MYVVRGVTLMSFQSIRLRPDVGSHDENLMRGGDPDL